MYYGSIWIWSEASCSLYCQSFIAPVSFWYLTLFQQRDIIKRSRSSISRQKMALEQLLYTNLTFLLATIIDIIIVSVIIYVTVTTKCPQPRKTWRNHTTMVNSSVNYKCKCVGIHLLTSLCWPAIGDSYQRQWAACKRRCLYTLPYLSPLLCIQVWSSSWALI